MGGCISSHRRERSYSSRNSGISNNSLMLLLFVFFHLASGSVRRNKPLNRSACRPKWKSDVSITERQLRRKREEYWDTGKLFLEIRISLILEVIKAKINVRFVLRKNQSYNC